MSELLYSALSPEMQEIPDATKQPKWTGTDPPKFDWDKEIKKVIEEGKEVPEIAWLKPGEDAAWEVHIDPLASLSFRDCSMYEHITQLASAKQAKSSKLYVVPKMKSNEHLH